MPAPGSGEPGRPWALTPEVQERILDGVTRGLYFVQACERAGITERTARNWMARGEAGEEPFCAFLQGLKAAESELELVEIGDVRDARTGEGTKPWQAAMTFLERRFPRRWGRKVEVIEPEVEAPVDPTTPEGRAKIVADLRKLPPEMLREAMGETKSEGES